MSLGTFGVILTWIWFTCYVFYIVFFFFLYLEFASLESMVFQKQTLYLHKIVIRSACSLPPQSSLMRFIGYIVVELPEKIENIHVETTIG